MIWPSWHGHAQGGHHARLRGAGLRCRWCRSATENAEGLCVQTVLAGDAFADGNGFATGFRAFCAENPFAAVRWSNVLLIEKGMGRSAWKSVRTVSSAFLKRVSRRTRFIGGIGPFRLFMVISTLR